MTESELYKTLGALTKNKEEWKANVPYVSSLLSSDSVKIRAKALWLLGEMGLCHPDAVRDSVSMIADFLDSEEPLLRERALNALGRIGRGNFDLIEPYWAGLFRFADDKEASVRLSFIWASENIAIDTPDPYRDYMPIYVGLSGCCGIPTTRCVWNRRRSSAFSESAARNSCCPISIRCNKSRGPMIIGW